MKKILLAAGLSTLMMGTTAMAEMQIGVSVARFDDNGLTVMRNGMTAFDDASDDVSLQMEDATDDVAKQLDQINNFIASGVDAIIVNAVDTNATEAMSNAAAAAGVPLVYVNRQPINMDTLPDGQAFVASNEIESGTLAAFQMCRQLRAEGKSGGARVYVLVGQLSNQAAVQRTKDFHDVIGMDMCNFITIIDEQTANWSRDEANDLMTNWLSSGDEFDAVFGNNDEMALGAIQAMKAAGISMDDVVVGGVDATSDALLAMSVGDMDVTVFQDLAGQGAGSIQTAMALANGEEVDKTVFIPFKLVTPENLADFQ
ncbi:monosaccharide ABC transporter substrate-binding protein (CUT2 family) [Yoonia maricola]|uniref:Monosaccharide ABC transporter substrate-binding protein (CUT2 family) n=1 Tax=Yoonia maricola TaxID=420999 RepID=A0A2M8WLY4_9RHOB|nr:sugar ABC transporter substrate-binding protein [Yoonia maricola]PJI91886.1 monosaccharide ABC transporter substrate-binding protein (CUT2 family) [Yoonia maricola]